MTTAIMRSADIILMCDRYLRARDERVSGKQDQMIREELSRKRLFESWRTPRTYETVKAEYDADSIWSEYKMASLICGIYHTGRVKDIKRLAENSIEISISSDDFALLETYK